MDVYCLRIETFSSKQQNIFYNMGDKPTIAISHLGCEKNRIDTEHMLGLLVEAGYSVDCNEELADYVIVNTCSFIAAAREESVKTLVELA